MELQPMDLRKRVVIASIFWQEMKERRPTFVNGTYIIAACERDAPPSLLVVEDTYETGVYKGDGQYAAVPVLASRIGLDLVGSWTDKMIATSADCGPGIWLCEGDAPTSSEIAAALSKQNKYANNLVVQADSLYRSGDKDDNIQDLHRGAARWLKQIDRPWIKDLKSENFTQCPACRETILAGAIVCKHCTTNIPRFMREMREFALETEKALTAGQQDPKKPGLPVKPPVTA